MEHHFCGKGGTAQKQFMGHLYWSQKSASALREPIIEIAGRCPLTSLEGLWTIPVWHINAFTRGVFGCSKGSDEVKRRRFFSARRLFEIAIVVMATSRVLAGWGRLLGTDSAVSSPFWRIRCARSSGVASYGRWGIGGKVLRISNRKTPPTKG